MYVFSTLDNKDEIHSKIHLLWKSGIPADNTLENVELNVDGIQDV
jgi:hypothetical protein